MQRNKNDSRVIKQPSLDSFSNPHRIFFPQLFFQLNPKLEQKAPKKQKPSTLTENVKAPRRHFPSTCSLA